MAVWKVRVFREGKLAGEGRLSPSRGGTVGREKNSSVLSPAVDSPIRLKRGFRNRLILSGRQDALKGIVADGNFIDRTTLIQLGVLKKKKETETLSIPFSGYLKVSLGACEILISEERGPLKALQAEEEVVASPLPLRFRRMPFSGDFGFLAVLVLSVAVYSLVHLEILRLPPPKIDVKRDIPRRFTRFIYEPPVIERREVAPPKTAERAEEEKKKEEAKEKPAKKEEKKPAEKVERVARKEVTPAQREKIRERIARKGILGILTGRGKAGYRFGEDVLSLAEEAKKIDVTIAGARKVAKGAEEIELVRSDIGEIEEKAGVTGTKKLTRQVVKTETGAEMEISGGIEDKSRSAQVIQSVISSYIGGVRYVYNRELKDNPTLAGKVTVAFTIEPDGSVSKVEIVSSTLNWPPLEEKLVRRISHWRFPPSRSGAVRVVFPFLFFPSM